MTWRTITIALSVAAVASVTAVLSPGSAEALPSQEVYRYYYSNASMTVEVGEMFVTSCYGVVNHLTGSKTAYVMQVSEPCNGGTPPPNKCYVHNVQVPCGY